jgi:hypothetical protein
MNSPVVVTPEMVVNGVVQEIAGFLGLSSDDNKRTAEQAVRVVYGLMHGHLRGRVPLPLPPDLVAVLRAAGTRYALMLLKVLRTGPQDPVEGYGLELPSFSGWLFPEVTVLARYRQKTA